MRVWFAGRELLIKGHERPCAVARLAEARMVCKTVAAAVAAASRRPYLTLPRIVGVRVKVNMAASNARKWGGSAVLLQPRDS